MFLVRVGGVLFALACLLACEPSCGQRTRPAKRSRARPDAGAGARARLRPLLGRPHLVLLGTGTPNPDPDRSGPALAVVVRGVPYIVDAGVGVVRRAAAAYRAGVTALAPERLEHVLLTHLHSDHTLGLADLLLTPWVYGRQRPLRVFGPPGTAAMVRHLRAAYEQDIRTRLEGREPANDRGHRVEVKEVEPGPVLSAPGLQVTAFAARHGAWKQAHGLRLAADGSVFCVSGDTAPHPELTRSYEGCDVLVHEVYSDAGLARRPAAWRGYHTSAHTSARELGRVARRVRPRLLVLTHLLRWGSSEAQLLREVRSQYDGRVVVGRDLLLVGIAAGRRPVVLQL